MPCCCILTLSPRTAFELFRYSPSVPPSVSPPKKGLYVLANSPPSQASRTRNPWSTYMSAREVMEHAYVHPRSRGARVCPHAKSWSTPPHPPPPARAHTSTREVMELRVAPTLERTRSNHHANYRLARLDTCDHMSHHRAQSDQWCSKRAHVLTFKQSSLAL